MATEEIVTHSAEETVAKGREIAARLRPPVLVLLKGDLGSGKTTLSKGIISGLGLAREEDVTSPTFNLVHEFRPQSAGQKFAGSPDRRAGSPAAPAFAAARESLPYRVYHVDLYRVDSFPDLESLGLEDALAENAVVIVEWPEHFTFRTDWPVVEVGLEHAGHDARRISISNL